MEFSIISNSNEENRRLVLLFGGWGAWPGLLDGLRVPGYDVALVWDYTTLATERVPDTLACYEEIAVVAWSYGVPGASAFIAAHPGLPITARIAVNGTQHPVDALRGIHPKIFEGTLRSLDPRNVDKFNMRMCGGASAYRTLGVWPSPRTVDSLRTELTVIGDRQCPVLMWDRAIVSTEDAIIPPESQIRAWSEEAYETWNIPGPHLPDFGTLLGRLLTDKRLVAQRFDKAARTYDTHATVQHAITDTLLSLIPDGTVAKDILEIGAGTGRATRQLAKETPRRLRVWDLAPHPSLTEVVADVSATDAETAVRDLPDTSVDLIFSASTVQWFNSLPEFLRQAKRVLRPGAIAAISTFGPETMREIQPSDQPTTRSRFFGIEAIRKMIPEGLIPLYICERTERLSFASPLDALRHIRATGVNALSADASPARARNAMANYPTAPDGQVSLTYTPIYIILQRKESKE